MTTWTQLRARAVGYLKAAGICDGRVEASRYAPYHDEDAGRTLARVYLRRGRYDPDGDMRAGVPDFVRERNLAISLIRFAPTEAALDDDLDAEIDAVLQALFLPPTVEWGIEAFGTVEITYDEKRDGEFRVIEAVIAIDVFDRIQYPPAVMDDFETIDVRPSDPPPAPGRQWGVDLYPPDGSIEVETRFEVPSD